jgi:hypothetical protein
VTSGSGGRATDQAEVIAAAVPVRGRRRPQGRTRAGYHSASARADEIREGRTERTTDVPAAVSEARERHQEWAVARPEVIVLEEIVRHRPVDLDGHPRNDQADRTAKDVTDELIPAEDGRRGPAVTIRFHDGVRPEKEACGRGDVVRLDDVGRPIRAPIGADGRRADVRERVVSNRGVRDGGSALDGRVEVAANRVPAESFRFTSPRDRLRSTEQR